MKVLTGSQFAQLDRLTMETEPIASIDLMERASTAIVQEIMARWDKYHHTFVFAGPGNNGGDGLAVARLLATQGYKVDAYLFNVTGKLSAECQANRDRLKDVPNVLFHEITQGFEFPQVESEHIVIDALFGTGLSKPMSGGFAHVAKRINACKAHVVSIDMPSGLMCEDNTYTDYNVVVHAELTLSMQMPRIAFLLPENETCVGEWKLLEIGLSAEALETLDTPFYIMEEQDIKELLRPRSAFAHKGTMGHALLVAGSQGMAGAAILSSKACLHSGIGKLTLHTAACNNLILQCSVPEAVLHLDEAPRYVSEVCNDLSKYQAIGVGPGLGTDEATAQALQQYLALSDAPMVLDADALNILARHPEWIHHIPARSILTPHPKEFDNMVGHCSNTYERLQRVQEFCLEHKLYMVLKGHYSALCTPTGKVLFCPRGNSGMATAGSGDVLTGIITGFIAQGYAPIQAAILGTWLHAAAGDHAAAHLGEEYMLAGDIIAHLPEAFRELK